MSHNPLVPSLYLLRQQSQTKPVYHYGVLDVGNRLGRPVSGIAPPVVIHQTPPSVTLTHFAETEEWQLLGKVEDESSALSRMHSALKNPNYDLFGNNCEHFARFIATGVRESTQLQIVGIVVGVATLIYAARQP